MSLSLGATSIGSLYLGSIKVGAAYLGNVKVYEGINYNPLNLPALTFRVKYKENTSPTVGTSTLVDATENIYDVTASSSLGRQMFYADRANLLEVIGANTAGFYIFYQAFQGCSSLTRVGAMDLSGVNVENNGTVSQMFYGCSALVSVGPLKGGHIENASQMFYNCSALTAAPKFAATGTIKNMSGMFYKCSSFTTVPKYDTSSATDVSGMFYQCTGITSLPLFDTHSVTAFGGNGGGFCQGCTALTSIPLFNTSSATNMRNAFNGCTNVESGALALYTQASSQTTPPTSTSGCFTNCGSNTVTGAAELAQIPTSWGGTAT
jgi:surface protein